MNISIVHTIGLVFLTPSVSFAMGGASGALDFIDSLILVILVIAVITHALAVYFKRRNNAFKQVTASSNSLLFSAITIIFWLIQFLNNIANRLYYSWPNYHGGVFLPVILVILMIIIVWTLKMTLQQRIHSKTNED